MAEQNLAALYDSTLDQLADLTVVQKKVLRAALKLFSQQGFEATSTAQIAQEAGVASGSVYKKFKNKQALLSAVLAPLFQGALQTGASQFFDVALEHGTDSLEDFVTTVLADRMRFVDQNASELKLFLGQFLTNPDFVDNAKRFFSEGLSRVMYPVIDRLQAENKMAKLPYDTVFQLLFGVLLSYFGKRLLGVARPLDEEVQNASQLLIKAFRV